MKTLLVLTSILALVCPLIAGSDAPVVRAIPPALLAKIEFLNPEYLVFSPGGDADTKVPLLIFLHGAGGVGDDTDQIKDKPAEAWEGIRKFNKGPCIVVAPQCLKKSKAGDRGIWTAEDLNLLLEHLKVTLPVDSSRIYLSGISMGGYGTWAWAAHNPEHFAAVAPIVGGIGREGPKAVTPDFDQWAVSLTKVPVFAFVGALDTMVPPERSGRMVAAIQKAGGKDAKIRIYPDEGHGAGRVVLQSEEFYEWMFSKKRN